MATHLLFMICVSTCLQLVISTPDKLCDPPPEHEKSRPCERKPEYRVGTRVKYCCNPGFHFSGNSSSAICVLDDDGNATSWDVPEFRCKRRSCDSPPDYERSRPCEKRKKYVIGTSVIYCCDSGYRFSGNRSSALCVLDENSDETRWDVPNFECLRESQYRTCDPPPELKRSRPCEKQEDYPVGTTVKYCCDPGFRFSDSTRSATCLLDNINNKTHWDVRWNGMDCRPVSCVPPNQIRNGHIIGNRYTFPNSVEYECNKGYKLQGLKRRYCDTTGKWSGKAPQCKIVTCPKPANIENGKVSFSSTTYSSVAVYECESRYRIEGNNKITCSEEGVWKDTPTCIEVKCPKPEDPVNGKVTIGGLYKDDIISYTCNEGRHLIGESFRKCLDDGTWSLEPPVCEKPCSVPKLGRGKMGNLERGRRWNTWDFVQQKPRSVIKPRGKLLLRCNEKFELPVEDLIPGDIEILCDDGTLKPKPACHPAWCRGPLPDNGRGIPPLPPYNKENSSLIEYRDPCSSTERVLEKKTALCKYGTWLVKEAVCHDTRCKANDLENLHIDISGNNFYKDGEILEIRCKDNFELATHDNIKCEDGQWEIKDSPCKPASCKHPPPDVHAATASVSFGEHGTRVDYRCSPPYELVSKSNIRCSYGRWTGEIPACKHTRCHTRELFGYEGIKVETKQINDGDFYIPSCLDRYDNLEVKVQCNKGIWEVKNDRFCKPGNCIVPYLVGGDLYNLVYERKWYQFRGSLNLKKVTVNSLAEHDSTFYLKCHQGLKFEGTKETTGNGIKITCNKKQWVPKPDCWHLPKTITDAPSTDRPNENQDDDNELRYFTLPHMLEKGMDEDLYNSTNNNVTSEIVIQNSSRECNYRNTNQYLLVFVDDQTIAEGTVPHGFSLKFGCQPIGSSRLNGSNTAICINGEWEPEEFPKCLTPTKEMDVILNLSSHSSYATYPGDVAVIQKHSRVDIFCHVTSWRIWPRLHHNGFSKSFQSKNGVQNGFKRFTYVTIEDMTDEYSGTFTCSSYSDSHNITIVVNGSNVSPHILCSRMDAGDSLSIVYEPLQISPGTKAYFSCRDNRFELKGVRNATCLETGKWSTDQPTCIRKCMPLPEIINGYREVKSITVGSDITYTCNIGYRLIGSRQITCQESGYWSDEPPYCIAIFCSVPYHPLGGSVYYSSTALNSEIEYRCGRGYTLIGHKTSRCIDDGRWSNDPPVCEVVYGCSPAKEIDNGYKQVYSSGVGSYIIYTCHRGYILNGEKKITCQANGHWSGEPPTCSITSCPYPLNIPNGEVFFSSVVFVLNSEIEYKCKSGHYLIGDNKSRCTNTGRWSNDPPICKKINKTCSAIDLVDSLGDDVFGKNITAEVMPSGSVVELVCHSDSSIMIGDKYVTCSPKGIWRGGNTKCIPGCKAVERPFNSSLIIEGIQDTYRVGDSITFSCPKDQELSIELQRVICLPNGWSDFRVPTCIPQK